MTKRSKRILFYSAVAVFFLLSYIVILYAEGYKYSFSDNKFVRTGAISIKTNTGASVYLNGRLDGNTSFFGDSYSVNGLIPGKYEIRVQKDTYSTWHKNISVEEGLVIDFSRVMILPQAGVEKDTVVEEIDNIFKAQAALVPSPPPAGGSKPKPTPKPVKSPSVNSGQASPTPTPTKYTEPFIMQNNILYQNKDQELVQIAKDVKGFSLSRYNNKIAWWTNDNQLWVMWLNDTNYQPYRKNGDIDMITKFSNTIKNLAWFRDEDHIVVDSNGYKVVEIDKRGGLNIVNYTH